MFFKFPENECTLCVQYKLNAADFKCIFSFETKNVIQGNLIAVAYTLRTYWNQFSLGGICNCKQE